MTTKRKEKRMFGWHFCGPKLRDGSPLPKVGKWETHKGELRMCSSGLHVGITPWDALQYAPGETLRLVEYAEVGEKHSDKVVCRKRRTIAQMDATEMLRYFARLQAISCIDRWQQEPPDTVLDWLASGDEAAWSAAESAAWSAASAARSAAWSAARSAAESAARSAAWSAARSAAESAAESAASAAWSAAWSAAESAAWSAASAAWSAASAASAAESDDFNALVYECFEGPMRGVGFKP